MKSKIQFFEAICLSLLVSACLSSEHGGSVDQGSQGNDPPPIECDAETEFESVDAKRFVAQYCIQCHRGAEPSGAIGLEKLITDESSTSAQFAWHSAFNSLETSTMPPTGMAQPTSCEVAALKSWFDRTFHGSCETNDNAGHVTLHKLTNSEYVNTVRDIFGITGFNGNDIPSDNSSEGFSNNADLNSITTGHLDAYFGLSEKAADKFLSQHPDSDLLTCPNRPNYGSVSCGKDIIKKIGLKLRRTPMLNSEADSLNLLVREEVNQGNSFQDGLKMAIRAMLVSPHFLYKYNKGAYEVNQGAKYKLNDYEIATRLSYFLWSSAPDEVLLELAKQGQLSDPATLRQQVTRMILDGKAMRFVKGFGYEWTGLKGFMKQAPPSPDEFPDFDPALKQVMLDETTLLFRSIMTENRSIKDLFSANYTYLNEDLANHYGINGPAGPDMVKVNYGPDDHRRGLLSHGSFLMRYSHPNISSIVKRGAAVIDRFLCSPPDPPPNANDFEDPGNTEGLTRRERLSAHVTNISCAACHRLMDPYGWPIDSFNAVGVFDPFDQGLPVDVSGTMPDGQSYATTEQFMDLFLADQKLGECISNKFMTYALGRTLELSDRCTVNDVAIKNIEGDKGFVDFIDSIVKSDIFQYSGEGAGNE